MERATRFGSTSEYPAGLQPGCQGQKDHGPGSAQNRQSVRHGGGPAIPAHICTRNALRSSGVTKFFGWKNSQACCATSFGGVKMTSPIRSRRSDRSPTMYAGGGTDGSAGRSRRQQDSRMRRGSTVRLSGHWRQAFAKDGVASWNADREGNGIHDAWARALSFLWRVKHASV
jgi:hypothetical protein